MITARRESEILTTQNITPHLLKNFEKLAPLACNFLYIGKKNEIGRHQCTLGIFVPRVSA